MFKAPKHIHNLRLLFDDLPCQDLERIAQHLDLTAATVRRYRLTGRAPRAVALALFWETQWGRSAQDADQAARELMRTHLIASLRQDVATLRHQVERLLPLASLGAANGPLFELHRASMDF